MSRASDRIVEEFREQILSGVMTQGTKLPTEKELCTAYDVSSVTVRAAMRSLATANLIEVRQGSGSYVTAQRDVLVGDSLRSMIKVDRITAPEILLVLGALYECAAELAALRTSEQEVEEMEAAIEEIDRCKTIDHRAEKVKYLLNLLAQASGSRLLSSLCKFLSGLQIDLTVQLWDGAYEEWCRMAQPLSNERRRLVRAIKEKDSMSARNAAASYHIQARKHLLKVRDSANAITDPMLLSLLSPEMKEPKLNSRRRGKKS